jgi:hypothetical protein
MKNQRKGLAETTGMLGEGYIYGFDTRAQRFHHCKDQCVGYNESQEHVFNNLQVTDIFLCCFTLVQQHVACKDDNDSRDRAACACAHVCCNVVVEYRLDPWRRKGKRERNRLEACTRATIRLSSVVRDTLSLK